MIGHSDVATSYSKMPHKQYTTNIILHTFNLSPLRHNFVFLIKSQCKQRLIVLHQVLNFVLLIICLLHLLILVCTLFYRQLHSKMGKQDHVLYRQCVWTLHLKVAKS